NRRRRRVVFVEPPLHIVARANTTRRRRRFEAVGMRKGSDRKEAVAQMQEAEGRQCRCGTAAVAGVKGRIARVNGICCCSRSCSTPGTSGQTMPSSAIIRG